MTSEKSGNPLDPVRKATEEAYFRKQNAELAAKLKARAQMQQAGVHDKDLADKLAAAGFSEDSVRALFLIPIIEIGWADGRLQIEERGEILKIAEARGISRDSQAFKLISSWIENKPSDSAWNQGQSLVRALMDDAGSAGSGWVLEAAKKVASATGGLFGIGSKISAAEEALLKKLSK